MGVPTPSNAQLLGIGRFDVLPGGLTYWALRSPIVTLNKIAVAT